jgi:hypothetical protein
MASANLEKVLEAVKGLTREEQRNLKAILDAWWSHTVDEPEQSDRQRIDELDRMLLENGLISFIPPPITDLAPYQNRKLIEVKGKPISETIIEERR